MAAIKARFNFKPSSQLVILSETSHIFFMVDSYYRAWRVSDTEHLRS